MYNIYLFFLDGRGGNPRRDHLTPTDLDDGQSADGHGDPTRGRNHVDITQLNNTPTERLQVSFSFTMAILFRTLNISSGYNIGSTQFNYELTVISLSRKS